MRKIISIFLISVIGLSSCKKEVYPDKLSGYVIDATTKEPIADADIGIFETITDKDIFSNGKTYSNIKYLKTDSKGYWETDFKVQKKNSFYFCKAGKEGYYPGGGGQIKTIKKRVFSNPNYLYIPFELELYKYAYVRTIVKNVNPYDQNDIAFVNTPNDLTPGYNNYEFKGISVFDSTEVFFWHAPGVYDFILSESIGVRKNNNRYTLRKEVYCSPGKVTRIFFEY